MVEVPRKDSLCIKTSSRLVFVVLILVSGVALWPIALAMLWRCAGALRLDDSWTSRRNLESRYPRRPNGPNRLQQRGDAVLQLLL